MKLEPIFLVEPKQQPAMVPTRRAVLIAIGSGLVGAAAGHMGGALLGNHGDHSPKAGTRIGDDAERYRWALGLADPATPIDELMAATLPFLGVVSDEFARNNLDERLWRAVDRIAERTLQLPRSEARQLSFVLLPTLRLRPDHAAVDRTVKALEELVR